MGARSLLFSSVRYFASYPKRFDVEFYALGCTVIVGSEMLTLEQKVVAM